MDRSSINEEGFSCLKLFFKQLEIQRAEYYGSTTETNAKIRFFERQTATVMLDVID